MEKLEKGAALKIDFFGKEYFFERPYLIKFKDALHISPKSQFKFFLKLPLVTKLALKSGEKSIEVDRHIEYKRKAWHGEVHRGVLCTYVEAEFAFDNPFETQDAIVPLRIVNKSEVPGVISKIVIDPENLFLVKGENGFFTNKVYILVISSNEFSVQYSTKTTIKAVNPQPIIDRKISVARTVLTRFDEAGI